MTLVKICLGDGKITFDHIHCGVTEHDLEGVRIAAITQIIDCKGVSEAMNVDALYTGAIANNSQYI